MKAHELAATIEYALKYQQEHGRRIMELERAVPQAAAELRRLAEVNAELLEALEPFAAFAKHYPKEGGRGNRATSGPFYSVSSGDLGEAVINVEDFHRAAALIDKAKEQQ